MSDIYVEITKEHLQEVKPGFEDRVRKFMHDFKQRRISYVLTSKKTGVLGLGRKIASRKDAEAFIDKDPEEQSLASQIQAGLEVLKNIFVAAAAAPAGTKFMVTLDQYQWFVPDGLVS